MDNLRAFLFRQPYAILQPEHHRDPLSFLNALLDAGVLVVQIRSKKLPDAALALLLEQCSAQVHRYSGILIVNDRVDLAAQTNADGVHLGQTDLPAEQAREILGNGKIIGLSTHNLEQAKLAFTKPIDYLALGPIFGSTTKSGHAPEVGLQMLSQIATASPLPLVAIGGISEINAGEVYQAGATSVAVISALENSHDLPATIAQLKRENPCSERT